MNLKSLVLSLAVAASLSPALQAGNVIVNGSLETSNTAITPIVNTYVAGTIPGWTVQGASVGAAGSARPIAITLLGTLLGFFIHANVRFRFGPLEYLVAMPAFHHWHHSRTDHIDHNYAATFPWIDRIFGTLYLPGHFPADYGIEAPLPSSITGQLLSPLTDTEAARSSTPVSALAMKR